MAIVQRGLRIVLPGGAHLPLSLDADSPEGVLGISRRALDWLLLENAQACGARVQLEQRVRGVLIEKGRVCGIKLAAGDNRESRELRSRVVIAADGRGSAIVRQTGSVTQRGPRVIGFKSHRPTSGNDSSVSSTIEMISLRGGYVGRCQVENGEQNLCGLLPPEALRGARGSIDAALGSLMFDDAIDLIAPRLSESRIRWQTMADVRQQLASPRVEGVLYVGDAMGTIEPLAGQGLAMALGGAQLAAEVLLADEQQRVDIAVQQHYAALWHSRFDRTIHRAGKLGWLLRHPRVLASLAKLAPTSHHLEELLFRACYRSTRLARC
jgi:flavin-dependent dehydrogenase